MSESGLPIKMIGLEATQVARQDDVIAITTPIPDELGNVSSKTPIFHLPIYKIDFGQTNDREHANEKGLEFHCDLADLTDLIAKLKQINNQWTRPPIG